MARDFDTSGVSAGLSDVRRQVEAVRAEAKKAAARKLQESAGALYELAQEVMADSEPLVPVDIGTLKQSGFVKKPVLTKDNASVEMGYGGQASDYALIQHEDLTFNHPNGGQAKYLEIPFLAMKAHFAEKLAAKIKARSEGA